MGSIDSAPQRDEHAGKFSDAHASGDSKRNVGVRSTAESSGVHDFAPGAVGASWFGYWTTTTPINALPRNMHTDTTKIEPDISIPIAASAAALCAVGWWASGAAVAVPIVILGVIAFLAAIVDNRMGRLPNRATGGALLAVAASLPLIAEFDSRSWSSVALAATVGIAYSGAPLLFVLWVIRPGLIGGGDWKMLGALGAGLGLALPFAALLMTTVACFTQITVTTFRRTNVMPFGPSIAVGYATAVLLLPVFNPILEGPYS